jgi:aryl-alcohol dehydrogenase-like predicted oxidoreductase
MEYRILPGTGWKVSQISFGCMSLSEDFAHSQTLLHQAVDLGINFFDTADLYQQGRNEEVVGAALKPYRDRVYIATKVGNQMRADGSGWDWNPSKKYILQAVEDSLRRLSTDYIDLYQLHGGTIDDPIDETIEAFELLKDKGLIRAYGISSIRPNVIREYLQRSNIVSVMMQYSLLDRRPEESVLNLLLKQEVGVLVRGAVAKGLLAGKPPKAYLDHSEDTVAQVGDALKQLENPNRSMGQTALAYVLHNPAVYSIAAGIRNSQQLLENADAPPALLPEEHQYLQELIPPLLYQQHR